MSIVAILLSYPLHKTYVNLCIAFLRKKEYAEILCSQAFSVELFTSSTQETLQEDFCSLHGQSWHSLPFYAIALESILLQTSFLYFLQHSNFCLLSDRKGDI